MKTIRVLNLVGETGLKKPGTLICLPDTSADLWIAKGWAELAEKQEMPNLETKEEKFVNRTKQTKNKAK